MRATAWPLAQQHRQAKKAVAQAESELARAMAKRERYQRHPRPGRPPSFEVAIERAELALTAAQQALVTVEQHQEQAQAAIQDLSHTYHPLELDTGTWRSPGTIEAALTAHFDTLEQILTQAALPDYAQAQLAKAKRQLPPMVESLHRFEQSRLMGSLLTTSVTKLCEFVMGGLWDRIHRELSPLIHQSASSHISVRCSALPCAAAKTMDNGALAC